MSQNSQLNPVLQAALNSLDVQLEEELARYRRQRLGRPVTTAKGLGRHQSRKPLDLIDVERAPNQPQRPALGMSTAPLADFPLYMVQPPPQSTASAATPPASSQVNVPPDAPNPLVSTHKATENLEPVSQREHQTPPEKPGNLATITTSPTPPEDYLESSEHLLRSLAQEESTAPPQKSFAAKLLTPLGVGSILLLLLSGATAVFVLSNPSSFAALGLDRFFGRKAPTPTAPSPTATTSRTGNADKDSPVVNGPDLATDEFVDLNLNTLSHLQASPKSAQPSPVQVPALPTLPNGALMQPVAPTVVPNNALPRRAADLSSVLLTPSPQGNAPYTPIPRVAPLPTPASTTPKSNTTSGAAYRSFKANTADKSAKANTDKSNKAKTADKLALANTDKSNKAKTADKLALANIDKSNKAKTADKLALANTDKSKTTAAQKQPASKPVQVATTPVGISSYYYVLLNSNSDRLLEQARTIIPDAYVEIFPQGSKIQMAALPTESEAKTLVEQLQRQGLAASIYHP